jgi:hypothetical protein
VVSGGRKASLAAILAGQGGQQNRQQISLRLRPIPFMFGYLGQGSNITAASDHSIPPDQKIVRPTSYHNELLLLYTAGKSARRGGR